MAVRLVTREKATLVVKLKAMSSLNIVVYSDDQSVRNTITTALGRRVAADMPEHKIHEFATGPALRLYVDAKKPVDLFILDGESVREGGLGIARQLKDELFNCPPILVITGRLQDNWLASWSRAEDMVVHPIDPFTLAGKVADLLAAKKVAVTN